VSPGAQPKRIAIVGGGIAGMAAAHRLTEIAPESSFVLYEKADRPGGVLQTVHRDGFQIETSADNFITTIPYGLDLVKRLGLTDQLVQTNPAFRRTYVVCRGKLRTLPDGFLMMAPTRMLPLATTPILSIFGKLRCALEYFIPPRTHDDDETMANFVRRRLGREAFDRLVEPLVSAVYAADMERLSVKATLPRFHDMERDHGSLVRAMRRQMTAMRRAKQKAKNESGARYSMFVTLETGLSQIIETIAQRLPEGALRLSCGVRKIVQNPGDSTWTVIDENGASQTFDHLILAIPSPVTAELVADFAPDMSAILAEIEHSGTAIVSMAFENSQIGQAIEGMGAVVPKIEKSPILAISFSSHKYVHRAPKGKTLLRVFVGGARAPEMAQMSEQELVPIVLGQLRKLLKIEGDPVFTHTAHWPRTMPQYHVGHLDRVARIEAELAQFGGLHLAGNAYYGVGLPDCIHSGELAAEACLG
jgi:protoporphyrinogen/coproporphyrinogen III oxidase